MSAQPTLTTPRLLLRRFEDADAQPLVNLCGPREVAEMTKTIPHPYSIQDAKDFLARIAGSWDRGDSIAFAVVLAQSQELVGSIGLRIDRTHRRAEVGYVILMSRWGQGIATEALRAILSLAFGELDLLRVFAHYFPENPASGRVLQKAGFRPEGLLKGHTIKWGLQRDLAVMGLIRDQWSEGSRPAQS